MKKSREFDTTLEECLERVLTKGETIDDCLRRFPTQAKELKPLLEMAVVTKKATAVQPNPEFKARARNYILAALRAKEPKRSRPFLSLQPQWLTMVAVVLAILVVGSGTVVAANSSMPDQPLYPVKLATEKVQLAFTPSKISKAELYAKLADRRVAEIVSMAGKNKPEQVQRTTRYLNAYLAQIADLATAYRATSDTGTPLFEQAPALGEGPTMATSSPTTTSSPMTPAPTFEKVVPTPAPAPATIRESVRDRLFNRSQQEARLKAIITYYAVNHPARLRAALYNAPPSSRVALLKAIADLETGYKKALQSIDEE
jgi:hypothetical protein